MNAASIKAATEAGTDFSAQSGLSKSSLCPEEQVRQRNLTNLAYTRMKNDSYQYQQRLIDEETWNNYSLPGFGKGPVIYVGFGNKEVNSSPMI